MRFSDFLLVSDPSDLDFIVGYTEDQNIRISVSDFFADNISGSGNTGYIPVFTGTETIGNSQIFQDGANIVIGGVNAMGYRLAVGGTIYAANGAVIETTSLGADAVRVISEEENIFIIPNDLGQSITSSRRIIHPEAVLTTESATLGQVNSAILNLENDIDILLDLKVDETSVGVPNGVASLDSGGKVPLSQIPDSIIGQVQYMGTWNAFTNTPTLNPLIPEEKGHYYVVSAAGVFGGVDYQIGDWIISNGVIWQKVDNTDAVTSVFGRIGAILALEGDYQDFYPRLSQAYDNPTWINTLAFTKITGVPAFLLENQTITLSGDVTGSGKTSISTTISNNSVSNEKLRDSVGTSVIGRTDNSTGDPADIQASTDGHVLLRSAGNLLFGLISSDSISSIDWSKITNTPTTLGGYGITDAYTKTESDNKFVPYTGANANVNLGSNNITANSFIKTGGTSSQFLKADGSVDTSQYVPTTRSVNSGTGLTGGGNLSSDVTIAFDTNWGDIRYAYRTREIIAGLGLLGGGDLSANRTLSFDTVWGDARYLAPLAGYVPYTGATTNVNLGEYGLRAGYFQLDTTPTNTPTTQGTIFWDENDNTIDAVLNGYIMKIGEDLFYPVKNQTGSTIAKGTAVRFAGTVGSSGRLLIVPFIADGSVPSTLFMGVTAETILNGEDGKVLWFGRIRGINTNSFNEGDILYASTTVPGGFQTTVPVAPNNIIQVAAVITKSINQGTLFIRPTLGSNINKDEGVKITSPSIGQLLQLQSGNIWENKSLGQVIAGLSTQFLKGDGSLDSTSYVPFSRQITINGTTFDLSLNRSYSVGTVTSVGLSVPTGFAVSNTPITSNGDIILSFDSGYSLPTNAKQLEWDSAYANRIASLTTSGTSGAATFISNVLNIPQYQAQGNYITNLTGEVTANGPGSVSATISNAAVINKVLTGLSVTGSSVVATDTILDAFGKLQGQVNGLVGGLQYQGTWNASTNTPTITSGVGTEGYFYIVSVAGNTVIDGLSGWQVGDWIVYHSPSWQKVDNTESVTSVNGQVGAVNLSTTEIPEGSNLYYTDARSRQSISLTVVGSSGAATYNNGSGVFNIPQYTLGGLGGVPTSRQLTINGVNYDLSSDRSWTVGDVRTDSSYANPSWILSLAWSKITGTPTTLSGYGITDAYTQSQVDSLLTGYVTLSTDQTITGLKTIMRVGASIDVLNFKIGTDTLYGLKVAYNQNELVASGEATWSFVNTFNRNGTGFSVTPISFFRGVFVTGERLLSASINANLLEYYGNNPSGRYPVYAYNTGVQQFSTGIIVGKTTGVVDVISGTISDLPSGVVANFDGRVIGQSAANSNEFVTLIQLGAYLPLTGGTLTGSLNGTTASFSGDVQTSTRFAATNGSQTIILTPNSGGTTNRIESVGTLPLALVSATAITLAAGGTIPQITLATTGAVTLTGALNGTSAVFSGNAQVSKLLLGTSTSNSYRINLVANSDFDTAGILLTDTNTGGRSYAIGSSITTIGSLEFRDNTAGQNRLTISSTGAATFSSLAGSGDRIVIAGSGGTLTSAVIGSGLSYSGGILTVTGGGSVAWSSILPGFREDYDLQFRPADNSSSYAGFSFASPGNSQNAGYFLIRGGADNDVYTQNGITLVADLGWLTLAQRTTASRGVRITTGTSTSVTRASFATDGSINFTGDPIASSSFRAPYFYDLDNTAYYGNFASTSVLNILQFGTSANSGRFSGEGTWGVHFRTDAGYIQFGPANTGHAHIYTDRPNFYFNAQLTVNGGSVINTNDIRATVFYDLNDTNYYLDPTSSTSLRTVGSWRSDSAAWDGEFSGKIQYHSNHWYIQAADLLIYRNSGGSNVFTVNQSGVVTATTFSGALSGNAATATGQQSGVNFTINTGGAGYGLVGVYNPAVYQGLFAMGPAYTLGAGGTLANFYGVSWTYDGAGYPLNTGYSIEHCLAVANAGTVYSLIGVGIWTSGLIRANGIISTGSDMRAPIFYDSNNTGYYLNPNGSSYLDRLELSGSAYFRPNNWVQFDSSYGIFWPNHYGAHLYPNSSTYTQLRIDGSKGGYGGIWDSHSAVAGIMYDAAGNGGVYREANGRWYFYYLLANDCMGIGTSITSPTYSLYLNKGVFAQSRIDATIYYDSANTAYYLDPNGSSYLAGSLEVASGYLLTNGVGGSMYMNSAAGGFGGYFQCARHLVIETFQAGHNVYVLDASGIGVVKNSGSQSWAAYSDARIKTVHSFLENNLSKLENINPIYYSFNNFDDDQNRIGLIAQEVQEHFPELVNVDPKTDNLTLDYTGLIPILLGAIKELKNKVENLEKQL